MPDYIEGSLTPWVSAKKDRFLDGVEVVISAVSLPFAEYKGNNDPIDYRSEDILNGALAIGDIDYLTTGPAYISEAEARTLALKPLIDAKCDVFAIWDGDEHPSIEQIENIIKFVNLNPWQTWFKLSYKNYVFDENTYLVDRFQPPRIFRVTSNGYTLKDFYFDNDVRYEGFVAGAGGFENKVLSYKDLPNKVIPPAWSDIKHLSWLSNESSKRKVAYQMAHFGQCSYKWDEVNDKLAFNEEYFAKLGLPIPEVASDH
jgi:hypothetical protein